MNSIFLCKGLKIEKIFIFTMSTIFGRGDYRPGWHQP